MKNEGFSIKIEEYAPLGDIILFNYTRDLPTIVTRYPKLNEAYKASFIAKLENIKTQEKKLVTTKQKAAITLSLYNEADELVEELIFVKDYIEDAGLDPSIGTALIRDLRSRNIEGACDKIETLKQYIQANLAPIVEEGMTPEFPNTLEAHKTSLAQKNEDQKTTSDSGIIVTGSNNSNYTDLYNDITNIADKAKKVFKNTPFEDQYVISKILQSMRSSNKSSDASAPTA